MWARWQGRRLQPNHQFEGHPLLTMWAGYVLQLPFYTMHPFNSDKTYLRLFRESWLADWAWYNSSARHMGAGGRYGLGAGDTPKWCSAGSGYLADRIDQGTSDCRIYSPYILAGYLPASPQLIRAQLLELLRTGEAVKRVPGTPHHILWRKAALDPGWQGGSITMVDFSSELFGLATLWLGAEFFVNNTDHAPTAARP